MLSCLLFLEYVRIEIDLFLYFDIKSILRRKEMITIFRGHVFARIRFIMIHFLRMR